MSIFLFILFFLLLVFFLVVIVVVSFLRNLYIEFRLAIFALELVVFGNIKFACTSWAERDFGLHAV